MPAISDPHACGCSGSRPGPDTIEYDDRTIGIGAHPIGIDVESFRASLRAPETAPVEAELDERYDGLQLVLGVERLDYTKGIPQKLDAFERIARAGSGARRA